MNFVCWRIELTEHRHAGRKQDVMAEECTGERSQSGHDDERHYQPLFLCVETGRNEPPHLVRDERRREDHPADKRDVEVEGEPLGWSWSSPVSAPGGRARFAGPRTKSPIRPEKANAMSIPAPTATHERISRVRSSSRCSRKPIDPSRDSARSAGRSRLLLWREVMRPIVDGSKRGRIESPSRS